MPEMVKYVIRTQQLLTPLASLNSIAEWAGSTETSTALCGVLRLEVLFLDSGSRELCRPPVILYTIYMLQQRDQHYILIVPFLDTFSYSFKYRVFQNIILLCHIE